MLEEITMNSNKYVIRDEYKEKADTERNQTEFKDEIKLLNYITQ